MKLPNSYERAFLEIEGTGHKISCWFNPKEYSISKTNNWTTKAVVGAALPTAQFTGGEPRTLSLDLIFDDSDSKDGDVRVVTDRLLKMMEIDQQFAKGKANTARPPKIKFHWGDTESFWAVCKTLKIQFTLFRANGVPIRCSANLTLTQTEKAVDRAGSGRDARQNPTTTGIAGIRSHIVRDGDTIWSIAYSAYGDPTKWRVIAETNAIDDPLVLRRGQSLTIPRDAT